jgi:hypothetical protein
MYIKLARNRVLLLLSLLPFTAIAQVLSNAQIEMVKQRLQQGATHRSASSSPSPTPVFALQEVIRACLPTCPFAHHLQVALFSAEPPINPRDFFFFWENSLTHSIIVGN